jgi:bifunctional DNA-binding transcriptional regulator/antitoxin component of YhaV-PrlF toxin-antitoxin module
MNNRLNNSMEKLTFKVDDIFEDIPGDPDNVIMKIPPEIIEHTGWREGDTLNIEIEDGAIIIKKL